MSTRKPKPIRKFLHKFVETLIHLIAIILLLVGHWLLDLAFALFTGSTYAPIVHVMGWITQIAFQLVVLALLYNMVTIFIPFLSVEQDFFRPSLGRRRKSGHHTKSSPEEIENERPSQRDKH